MTRITSAVVLAVVLTTAFVVQAQFRESIDVSIVNLDVVVTDGKGNRVHRLTKDDFEVYENRRLQPITNFAEYREAAPASTAAVGPEAAAAPVSAPVATEVSQKRAILLFIERVRLAPERGKLFFNSIRSLLRSTMRKGDIATIVTWDRGLMLVRHQATGDLNALERTLDRIAFENSSPMLNPYSVETGETALAERDADEANAFYASHGGTPTAAGEQGDLTVYERHVEADTRDKVRALSALTRAFGQVDARKVLIMAARLTPVLAGGTESPIAKMQKDIGTLGQAMEHATESRRHAGRLQETIEPLIEAANANGVTIYPVVAEDNVQAPETSEARGIPKVSPLGTTPTESLALLERVAQKTGGELSSSISDAQARMPRIAGDLQSYYSLAYRPAGASGARDVVVKVKRKGLVVRSRSSYIVKSDEVRFEDSVIGGLFGATKGSGFPIFLDVGAPVTRRGTSVRPLKVRIPVRALTPIGDRGGYRFNFTVEIVGSGLRGVSTPVRRKQSFRTAEPDLEKVKAGYYTFETALQSDAASRRISIGVVDDASGDYAVTTFDLGSSESDH